MLIDAFHQLIPQDIMLESNINNKEFNLMLNGKKNIDIEELRAFTMYQSDRNDEIDPFDESHDSIIWFWRFLRESDERHIKLLLQFFTGFHF